MGKLLRQEWSLLKAWEMTARRWSKVEAKARQLRLPS